MLLSRSAIVVTCLYLESVDNSSSDVITVGVLLPSTTYSRGEGPRKAIFIFLLVAICCNPVTRYSRGI